MSNPDRIGMNLPTEYSLEKQSGNLSSKDIEFCRWYTGLNVDDYGGATELDPVNSAMRAGFTPAQSQKMLQRLRNDIALQMQIAVYNRTRRGETVAKLESYARRSVDIVMGIAENSEVDSVRLAAAKLLMGVGGIREGDPNSEAEKKQTQANEEFLARLNQIKNALGSTPTTFTPFTEVTPIVDAVVFTGETKIAEPDDNIVD